MLKENKGPSLTQFTEGYGRTSRRIEAFKKVKFISRASSGKSMEITS